VLCCWPLPATLCLCTLTDVTCAKNDAYNQIFLFGFTNTEQTCTCANSPLSNQAPVTDDHWCVAASGYIGRTSRVRGLTTPLAGVSMYGSTAACSIDLAASKPLCSLRCRGRGQCNAPFIDCTSLRLSPLRLTSCQGRRAAPAWQDSRPSAAAGAGGPQTPSAAMTEAQTSRAPEDVVSFTSATAPAGEHQQLPCWVCR
jgi:hypothetical protein